MLLLSIAIRVLFPSLCTIVQLIILVPRSLGLMEQLLSQGRTIIVCGACTEFESTLGSHVMKDHLFIAFETLQIRVVQLKVCIVKLKVYS